MFSSDLLSSRYLFSSASAMDDDLRGHGLAVFFLFQTFCSVPVPRDILDLVDYLRDRPTD